VRKILGLLLVLAMLFSIGIPAMAASGPQTIYLKGSGSDFKETWQNVFYLGGAKGAEDPNVWHLVYTGNNFSDVTSMQLTFTNGEVFNWIPSMGPSVNGGGKNPGWVIVAPYNWAISYVDKGNNNQSGSFIVTKDTKNVNFNISGYHKGKPDKPKDPSGSLSFLKKVEKQNIVAWLTAKGWRADVLAGIQFYLNGVGTDGKAYSYGPVSPNTTTGEVAFSKVYPGQYVLSETITGAAVGKFKAMQPIDITIAAGENNFFVLGGTIKGVIENVDLRADDRFTIVNGYGSDYQNRGGGGFGWGYGADGIGYPGLNASGHVFYIGVTNQRTGVELYSFCANAGSTNFAEGWPAYMVAHSMNDVKWISAFNYINDKYGDLNDQRVITQVITWAMLSDVNGAPKVDVYALDQTRLTDAEKAAIIDVWENYEGYVGSGVVVDVVYMQAYDANGSALDLVGAQPQIVPIFGKFYVENELVKDVFGEASFNKTVYDGLVPISAGMFSFKLFEIVGNEEILVGTFSNDSNGVVSTGKILKPGNYVFKEVWTLFWNANPDGTGAFDEYNLVWHANYPGSGDGLYFEINAIGGTVWRDYAGSGLPTVNNKLYCKHHVLWGAGDVFYFGHEYEQIAVGGDSIIRFCNWCDKDFEIIGVTAATCEHGTRIWLACPDGCTGTGIFLDDQLDHFLEFWALAGTGIYGDVWVRCPNGCGTAYIINDEAMWLANGGWELIVEPVIEE